MAAAVFLTVAFLICQVNSHIHGLVPSFSITRGFEPTGISAKEVSRTSVPVVVKPTENVQAISNLVSVSQPIFNTISSNQPYLNTPPQRILKPTPPIVQNQQPIINIETQSILNEVIPNVQTYTPQVTPSVIKPPTPVVTVVDSALADSLVNALQLLILSNILDNSGTCNSQSPCVNNYEIVTPDFTTSAVSCEYTGNINYPEPIISVPEPIYTCPEPVFSIPETVVSSEPVYQIYPGSYSGIQLGSNQCIDRPGQYPVAPGLEVPIPATATVEPIGLQVPFPASIPAQLTCNFGLLPSNQPCVTFNVEPVPCNNAFGSFGNFF